MQFVDHYIGDGEHLEYTGGIIDTFLNNETSGFLSFFNEKDRLKFILRNNKYAYLMAVNGNFGRSYQALKKYYNIQSVDDYQSMYKATKENSDIYEDYWTGKVRNYNGKYRPEYVTNTGKVDFSIYGYPYLEGIRPIINLSGNTKAKTVNSKIYLTK